MEQVPLPFTFSFFGAQHDELYINANGYVSVSSTKFCNGAFLSIGCNFNSDDAYRGVVGPLITDFNPAASLSATVYFRTTADSLCVNWVDVPLWSPTPTSTSQRYTTRMCLYEGGAMRWSYHDFPYAPNNTVWMAGMRSRASTSGLGERTALARRFASVDGGDVAVDTSSVLLLSAHSVGNGNVAGVCTHHSVGCLTPRCGPAGSTLKIRWKGVDCGPDSAVQVMCQLGTRRVPATFGSDAGGAFITCTAPPQSVFSADPSSDLTLKVDLLMATPVAPGTGPGRGVGSRAQFVDGGTAYTSMDVRSVLAEDLVTGYNGSTLAPSRRLRAARSLQSDPTVAVLQTDLLFTYTSSGAVCGCEVDAVTECDACGACGGNNSTVDCAGVCFGAARVDDCGVCAGGSTNLVPNADMDCKGVCGGGATNCAQSPLTPFPAAEATSIVVVVALGCCLFALMGMCLWFFRVSMIQRRRRIEFALEMAAQGPQGISGDALSAIPIVKYTEPEGDEEPGTCAVCLDDLEEGVEVRKIPCNHMFHVPCLDKWLERSVTCPMCKADLRTGIVGDPNASAPPDDDGSASSAAAGSGAGAAAAAAAAVGPGPGPGPGVGVGAGAPAAGARPMMVDDGGVVDLSGAMPVAPMSPVSAAAPGSVVGVHRSSSRTSAGTGADRYSPPSRQSRQSRQSPSASASPSSLSSPSARRSRRGSARHQGRDAWASPTSASSRHSSAPRPSPPSEVVSRRNPVVEAEQHSDEVVEHSGPVLSPNVAVASAFQAAVEEP